MFKEAEKVQVFMRGDFSFNPPPKTVEDLKTQLQSWVKELDTWDKNAEIVEIHMHNNKMQVTLAEGIVQ
jgi:hypothetical protein